MSNTIFALRQLMTQRHCVLDISAKSARPLAHPDPVTVTTIVCTTGEDHLLSRLPFPHTWLSREQTDCQPSMLGFECHRVLQDNRDRYDMFAYLEDDLLIKDAHFLDKVRWFAQQAGSDALLQPNRFETSWSGPFHKVYVDGNLKPRVTSSFQDIADQPKLSAQFLDRNVSFIRPLNPHSGCFFMIRSQLDHWLDSHHFLDRDTSFIGPLESAASLSIMRAFRVYKPGPTSMDFLEIQHQGTGFASLIGKSVDIDPAFGDQTGGSSA